MDKMFFRACGLQNPLVYNIRNITGNKILHKFLECLCIPTGLIKYFLTIKKDTWEKNIAVVAIAKNEGPYLEEWINFYLKQGIDNVIIYDNESEDNTKEILNKYIKSGKVIYHSISGKQRQYDAYHKAIKAYKNVYKYLAFLDCDEFLFYKEGRIIDFVEEAFNSNANVGGVAINWLVFGSSGFKNKPDGRIVDNYLYRADDDFEANHIIKTVCNPRRVLGFSDPHRPYYIKGIFNIDEDYEPVYGNETKSVKYKKIRINHYFTKSKEEYIKKKNRGRADISAIRGMDDFIKHDRNEVKDMEILEFIEKFEK